MVVHVITIGGESTKKSKNPLNPLNSSTRTKLYNDLYDAIYNNNEITSIVLTGGPNHFSAGADITEFSNNLNTKLTPSSSSSSPSPPSLIDICNLIDSSTKKPIIAAIGNGVALGGGCEVALACHYRIATYTSKIGLPEVNVGVIPGAGGTQRLPRLIGFTNSIDMICNAKIISNADKALKLGLIDAICPREQNIIDCASKWAEWTELLSLTSNGKYLPKVSSMIVKESKSKIYDAYIKTKNKLPLIHKGGEGVHNALDAIYYGAYYANSSSSSNNFMDGMKKENELFNITLKGLQGQSRRHIFFAVRTAQKPPSPSSMVLSTSSTTGSTKQEHVLLSSPQTCDVGVIGAGTMGSGIALTLLLYGNFNKVYLIDVQKSALDKGMKFINRTIDSYVKKKRLTLKQATIFKDKIVGSTKINDLTTCTLVVEAIIENMSIKKKIFTSLNNITPPNSILVTNTSTLNVDEISESVFINNNDKDNNRLKQFAGLHFFSPAHVMKLVEIVKTKHTSIDTLRTLQQLTKRINKIGVIVGNCDGFVGNRMLNPYTSEMVLLLIDNDGQTSIQNIDNAITSFGMAMGPFQMSDVAGNDIGYFIRKERGLVRDKKKNSSSKEIPIKRRNVRYTELADDLVTDLHRIGQKAMKGWYDYNPKLGKGRLPIPSKEVSKFIKQYLVPSSSSSRSRLTDDEIIERILYPLVNEGFKILEENIASRPSDIDVVYVYGYGWPIYKGGPMFWADNYVGLKVLYNKLNELNVQFPGSNYYIPSKLLQKCVTLNVTLQEYYDKYVTITTNNFTKSKL